VEDKEDIVNMSCPYLMLNICAADGYTGSACHNNYSGCSAYKRKERDLKSSSSPPCPKCGSTNIEIRNGLRHCRNCGF